MPAKKRFRFSLQDIATATGMSLAAVKKASQRGKFDPNNLLSLARFVVEMREKKEGRPAKSDPQASPEPASSDQS